MNGIKKIIYNKKLFAIIVEEKKIFRSGVNFVTPNSLILQLGFINYKSKDKNTLTICSRNRDGC